MGENQKPKRGKQPYLVAFYQIRLNCVPLSPTRHVDKYFGACLGCFSKKRSDSLGQIHGISSYISSDAALMRSDCCPPQLSNDTRGWQNQTDIPRPSQIFDYRAPECRQRL